MKRILFFLLPVLLLAGCKPGEENNPAVTGLQIEPKLITCPATGGDYTIEVNSPNGEWTATASASWIRVTPSSGGKGTAEVRIRIDTNKESAESKGFVTFVSGEEKVELPVSRAAKAAPYLRVVSEKALNTPKEGGSYTVQVESNIKWSIASNTGWAKVNKGVTVNNDNITITVDAATTPEETEAVIVVKPYGEGYDAGSDTVYITRGSTEATSLTVDPEFIEVPENGGSYTINVSSNAQWRVYKDWYMDWVTFTSATEGSGSGSFGISVDAATSVEALSGIITIEEVRSDNYKPVKTQVYIERAGKAAASLSVSPTTINAPAEGGEYSIEIESNYPWTATVAVGTFFSVSAKSGEGDATMVVTVDPATNTNEKTGCIIIYSTFGGEQARIYIKREGKEPEVIPEYMLSLDTYYINSSAEGGKYTVHVTSNTTWGITTTDTDIASVNKAAGEQNDAIEITVSRTSGYIASMATVTVATQDGSVSRTITVVREGRPRTKYVPHPISIGKNKKVYFSPGNVQYQASTAIWRFAEKQYSFVGGSTFGNVYENGVKSNNGLISDTYDGWIDLFGWKTGNNPTQTSEDWHQYFFPTRWADWGVNPIWYEDRIIPANTYRSLQYDEWEYILYDRPNASMLHGLGTVDDNKGLILLPDDWVASLAMGLVGGATSFDANVYTVEQWEVMESYGAVFLPAACYRKGTSIYLGKSDISGLYWTNSILIKDYDADLVYRILFSEDCINCDDVVDWGSHASLPNLGLSVRLVQDVE